MNQIHIKSEDQPEEILLYYMDENGMEQSMVTSVTVGNSGAHHQVVQQIVPEIQEPTNQMEIMEYAPENQYIEQHNMTNMRNRVLKDKWTEEETRRLLIFYIDNKEAFRDGKAKKKHLWTVACNAMLQQKNAISCEMKLHNIKRKFIQIRAEGAITWPFYELCSQAFYDDELVNGVETKPTIEVGPVKTINKDGIVIIKKQEAAKTAPDAKVIAMLKLYIEHKNSMRHVPKELWQRGLWESIATQLGSEEPEYWHRRFMNFKQNYVRLLDKKQESGVESITWPYFHYFDTIYKDDAEFKERYLNNSSDTTNNVPMTIEDPEWDITEKTVLAKYVFDCFSEFCDPTIPKKFLWSEVGRLLERNAELCEMKYQNLKTNHLNNLDDGYDLRSRLPLAIILDNIISKEVSLEIESAQESFAEWSTSEIDVLVQFVYQNIEMVKDPICVNVCWARVGCKLTRSAFDCKNQWDVLVALYDSILKDKKNDPEMEIDWRYIEMFDRIFDYGTDEEFLNAFRKKNTEANKSAKDVSKKSSSTKKGEEEFVDEDTPGRNGDPRAFKILEYFQKHRDLFRSPNRNKTANWQSVAKLVNMSPTQCAHRFRNLKQVYMSYLNRECKHPDKPIIWPYFDVCKKVFGYKSLKCKIQRKSDSDFNIKEWTTKDIKALIDYFGQNFDVISKDFNDLNHWTDLAEALNKDEDTCRAKFLELRKSYRKLKTMLTRNPQTKVSWKYFNELDSIYTSGSSPFEIEALENYEMMELDEDIKKEIQDDDDIQCIIVVPEGQTIEDVLMQRKLQEENEIQTNTKWTIKTKKQLLKYYLKYIQSQNGQLIDSAEMWKCIASNFKNKTPVMCRRMFVKLKQRRLANETLGEKRFIYEAILDEILSLKPKFVKKDDKSSQVSFSDEKTEQILRLYCENLEEFLSPKFEKKKVWLELANKVNEPMMKVYKNVKSLKLNFKQNSENHGLPFYESLQEIFEKQKDVKEKILDEKNAPATDFSGNDDDWSEGHIEQLLIWYLVHLEKFKNPKYIRSFLWKDASNIVEKSPLACSKKMTEIRTEYKNKIKNPEELKAWKFAVLCQKIYGTGKKL